MNCSKLVYIYFDPCIHLIKPLWILSESPKYLKNSKHLHDCSKVEFTSTKRSHGLRSLWNLQARILEWVAFPFSRGSSQPRNWTGVSCIAGWFFTNWAIREVHKAISGSCFLYPYFWRNQKSSLENRLICKCQYPTANLLIKQHNSSMNSWSKQKLRTKYFCGQDLSAPCLYIFVFKNSS